MASQLDIVNRALLAIGSQSQVSSISPPDGSVEANIASVLFQPAFEWVAREAHWNCLRKQAALTVLAAAVGTPENMTGTSLPVPPPYWKYVYALPSDCLRVRQIFMVPPPTSTPGTVPQYGEVLSPATLNPINVKFQVSTWTDASGNPQPAILTNAEWAQCIYTVNLSNPAFWDSQFQQAVVAYLASEFVPPLNLNLALMQAQVAMAKSLIEKARTSDGNEGTLTTDHTPDYLIARGAGRTTDTGYYQPCVATGIPWGNLP